MLERKAYESRYRRLVTHHLRHIEQSRFERCRATGHQSCRSMGQQRISLVFNQGDVRAGQVLFVISILNRWRTRQHGLVVWISVGCLNHGRQIVLNFLFSASCQQGNDRFVFVKMIRKTKLLETFGI